MAVVDRLTLRWSMNNYKPLQPPEGEAEWRRAIQEVVEGHPALPPVTIWFCSDERGAWWMSPTRSVSVDASLAGEILQALQRAALPIIETRGW